MISRSNAWALAQCEHHQAAPSQIALAWILKRGPVMLPIPGTSKVAHLEIWAAVEIELSDAEFSALDKEAKGAFGLARIRIRTISGQHAVYVRIIIAH